jgi:uncharacterized membrane protein (DUF2068 family)
VSCLVYWLQKFAKPETDAGEPALIVAGETTKAGTPVVIKGAPTLYAIIAMKLAKGLLFVSLAVVAYTLSDNDLPFEYRRLLHFLRLNPESKFFSDLAVQVGSLNERRVLAVAAGTFLYSLFSMVEGVGLIFRVEWAGWMAIGESSFFIPIEVYELIHRFSRTVVVILILNVIIVWYLLKNRQRLFHHHTPQASRPERAS